MLGHIERIGNKLPHPTTLFIGLILLIILVSAVFASGQATDLLHPLTKDPIHIKSLLTQEGAHWILSHMVENFTQFAPVGPVLVAMLGIGLAEGSGLMRVLLKRLVSWVPLWCLSFTLVLLGVLSSIAADAGYVILIPLGAAIFKAAGRNPLEGIGATFAGVSAGYCANVVIGPLDVMLSGLSTQAAHIVNTAVQVGPAANYFLMVFLTLLFSLAGAWITDQLIQPRLLKESDPVVDVDDEATHLVEAGINEKERVALRWALLSVLFYILFMVLLTVPEQGLLRHPQTLSLLVSPFMSGLIVVISIGFAIGGVVFGYLSGHFTGEGDVIVAMEESIRTMAGYIVLMFFAAQFVSFFNWTNLGLVVAMKSAQVVQALSLPPMLILFLFMFATALMNLLIGSASAKWALLAPIVVPVFLLLDVQPDVVQAAYRIADSSTNIITPMMPYFGIVVAFVHKYEPKAGMGTLAALMLPYSLAFFVLGSAALFLWCYLGLPMGV